MESPARQINPVPAPDRRQSETALAIARGTARYLHALGYAGHLVAGNRLLPVSTFDATVHQKQDGERFWKAKGYCNNFVFSKTRPPGMQG